MPFLWLMADDLVLMRWHRVPGSGWIAQWEAVTVTAQVVIEMTVPQSLFNLSNSLVASPSALWQGFRISTLLSFWACHVCFWCQQDDQLLPFPKFLQVSWKSCFQRNTWRLVSPEWLISWRASPWGWDILPLPKPCLRSQLALFQEQFNHIFKGKKTPCSIATRQSRELAGWRAPTDAPRMFASSHWIHWGLSYLFTQHHWIEPLSLDWLISSMVRR